MVAQRLMRVSGKIIALVLFFRDLLPGHPQWYAGKSSQDQGRGALAAPALPLIYPSV